MNIAVTFKHIGSSDAIRQYAESKVLKLEKYLNNIMEAHITLSMERVEHKESGIAQIKLTAKNLTINAEEKSSDIYSAIDLLMEKVEAQIKKHKEKNRRKDYEDKALTGAEEEENICWKLPLKPLIREYSTRRQYLLILNVSNFPSRYQNNRPAC